MNPNREATIKHAFITMSEKFGHKKPYEDVFELFGQFEEGQENVIFNVGIVNGHRKSNLFLIMLLNY